MNYWTLVSEPTHGNVDPFWVKLTDVNICQGSKNKKEATNHNTYVDSNETMSVKNIGFLKSWVNVKAFPLTSV